MWRVAAPIPRPRTDAIFVDLTCGPSTRFVFLFFFSGLATSSDPYSSTRTEPDLISLLTTSPLYSSHVTPYGCRMCYWIDRSKRNATQRNPTRRNETETIWDVNGMGWDGNDMGWKWYNRPACRSLLVRRRGRLVGIRLLGISCMCFVLLFLRLHKSVSLPATCPSYCPVRFDAKFIES